MFRPCGGCARRRERIKALWHAVRGGTLRGDSVMLSGDRHAQARALREAEAEREANERMLSANSPLWQRQLPRGASGGDT